MSALPPAPSSAALARQARERFAAEVDNAVAGLVAPMVDRLTKLSQKPGTGKETQDRRAALMGFLRQSGSWIAGVRRAWRLAWTQPAAVAAAAPRGSRAAVLELIDDEEVETRIEISRLALAITHKVNWELNDLRLRIQQLENSRDLASNDVFRPEIIAGVLMEQWTACGLTRDMWTLAQDGMRGPLIDQLLEAYHHANEFLINQGVMREIDLKPLLKRNPDEGVSPSRPAALPTGLGPAAEAGHGGGSGEATRLMTQTTPPARELQRAQGVLGQLKRLLGERVTGFGSDAMRRMPPSPALTEALRQSAEVVSGLGDDIEQINAQLRQRTTDIKRHAGSANEKATVEIVALMFQSILAEERIPASVRVWVARLQMPVLRVALAEPEFFGTLHHPARQLIDRMGSCVMGFDAGVIGGSALEAEIRRVVQVIEQYPETGRKVFQLVLEEFQKFLAGYLTDKDQTRRVVSVAQQVEQKETLAIQYTIELRAMLNSMPVRPEIREFLFKVWAEVLAMAAIRHGAQHADTLMLKRVATDLLWTAGAKPNRQERARVLQQLPLLQQRLRQGMTLLGLTAQVQAAHLKVISDTLADAFMSRTELIPQEQLDDMADRLANLDAVVGDAPGEVELDADDLAAMLGPEHADTEVIADGGGAKPSDAMLAWAKELPLGNWFRLDHNGDVKQVQLVWRSDRGQLHLFVAADGRSALFQVRRLAAYLQAGLLAPAEEDALTVRATREALAKLDANPERLLN